MYYRDLSDDDDVAIEALADHFDVCRSIADTVLIRARGAYRTGIEGATIDQSCECGLCEFVKDAHHEGTTKKDRVTLKLSSATDGFCDDCGNVVAHHEDACGMCEGKKIVRQVMITAEGSAIEAWADNDQTIEGDTWETTGDGRTVYAIVSNRPKLVEDLRAEGYTLDLTSYNE